MSYYVREIVNSLYYSILKKSSFFFFYMTTRDFNLCISLINLASNIQILNNCIQHVGTNRQWTPSKYTQKCSWRFAI